MADQKITELNVLTAVDAADLLAVVDDPTGSAETKKAAASDVCLGGMVDIGAKASNASAETITTGTWTALACDTEDYDTDSIHDTVTNNSRLTCQTAGKYWVWGVTYFAANGTGDRGAAIDLNGGGTFHGYHRVGAFTTGDCFLPVGVELSLSVSDYVELRCRHSRGTDLDCRAHAFGMRKVG